MGEVSITKVELSSDFYRAQSYMPLSVTAHVHYRGLLSANTEVYVYFVIQGPKKSYDIGEIAVKWRPPGKNLHLRNGTATLSNWEPGLPPGSYQLRCQLSVANKSEGVGRAKTVQIAVYPRLLTILPAQAPPLVAPQLPPAAIDRPRGSHSVLPLTKTNLPRAERFGLSYSTEETGYPLFTFGGSATGKITSDLSRTDYPSGLCKTNHVFFPVYDVASDRDKKSGNYGLVDESVQERSDQAVKAGDERIGYNREEEKISFYRDAIELDPNNLYAYLKIADVLTTLKIPPNMHRARRYFQNLFFKLYAAVKFIGHVLKHGDPERQDAFRIWDQVGVYILKYMKPITRVRRAYTRFPKEGFIKRFHEVGQILRIDTGSISPDALRWLHLPETQMFSKEELTLIVPHLYLFPIDDYFRRRLPLSNKNPRRPDMTLVYGRSVHEGVYRILNGQYEPIKYRQSHKARNLSEWIRYTGRP